MEKLTITDFARSFGVNEEEFSESLKSKILSFDFSFERPDLNATKGLILEVLQKIRSDTQIIGAYERTQKWHDGWKENLDDFRSSEFDEKALVPKFVRPGNPIRWFQQYIIPQSDEFELQFIKVYLHWLAETYFSEAAKIHEFGSGTGYNLLSIAKIFPDKEYLGSDFVGSSVDLINEIANSAKNIKLKGLNFNMLKPNFDYSVSSNDAVFTFGSLEQLASDVEPMIKFLVSKKPKIVIHTEPIEEFYDLENLEDYLAYQFQSKRGYSSGLIGHLENLERQNIIQIVKKNRLFFGSFFMEGYNHIAWRPL